MRFLVVQHMEWEGPGRFLLEACHGAGVANPPGIEIDARNLKRALKLVASGIDVDYQGVSGPCNFDGHGDVPGSFEVWRFSGGSIETVTFITVDR